MRVGSLGRLELFAFDVGVFLDTPTAYYENVTLDLFWQKIINSKKFNDLEIQKLTEEVNKLTGKKHKFKSVNRFYSDGEKANRQLILMSLFELQAPQ